MGLRTALIIGGLTGLGYYLSKDMKNNSNQKSSKSAKNSAQA
jgi:hypothetical protein